MKSFLEPEVARLDISRALLTLCALAGNNASGAPSSSSLRWLTSPPLPATQYALSCLERCGCLASRLSTAESEHDCAIPFAALSARGRAMARLPLDPAPASVLLCCENRETLRVSAAMAALWESEPRMQSSADLFEQALLLRENPRSAGISFETTRSLEQIDRMVERLSVAPQNSLNPEKLRESVTAHWTNALRHRIAVAESGSEKVYRMSDGRSGRLDLAKGLRPPQAPPAIVALQIHETAGRGRQRSATIPWYLPLQIEWLEQWFAGACKQATLCRWDEKAARVIAEETVHLDGLVIRRLPGAGATGRRNPEVAAMLAQKVMEGLWPWRELDEQAWQLVLRIKLAAKAFPEMDFPSMDDGDWRLVYNELCEGKSSFADLSVPALVAAIREYISPHRASFLERAAPQKIELPSGRKGKITYFENDPPELSARITDFAGHPARFTILDGRVKGVFNILAPNYRTVQKTADLAGFWKTAYPQLKKELQRKYPRHPWP